MYKLLMMKKKIGLGSLKRRSKKKNPERFKIIIIIICLFFVLWLFVWFQYRHLYSLCDWCFGTYEWTWTLDAILHCCNIHVISISFGTIVAAVRLPDAESAILPRIRIVHRFFFMCKCCIFAFIDAPFWIYSSDTHCALCSSSAGFGMELNFIRKCSRCVFGLCVCHADVTLAWNTTD